MQSLGRTLPGTARPDPRPRLLFLVVKETARCRAYGHRIIVWAARYRRSHATETSQGERRLPKALEVVAVGTPVWSVVSPERRVLERGLLLPVATSTRPIFGAPA